MKVEVKFLRKSEKNVLFFLLFFFFFFFGGGGGWGVRWGVALEGEGGFRVDVNAMLGVGGDVGYRDCKPRIEGIVQCTKRYCIILKKNKMWGGEGDGKYLNPKHSLCIYIKKRTKKSKKKYI